MIINKIKQLVQKIDRSNYGNKNIDNNLGSLYHENSKLTKETMIRLGVNIGMFENAYILQRSSQPYKIYSNNESISLSLPTEPTENKSQLDLLTLLKKRRSGRLYSKDYQISKNELSQLLYYSYGVTKKVKINKYDVEGSIGFRCVPSAGGLYPLEVYVVVLRGHLEKGLYHYRSDNHTLEVVSLGDFTDKMNSYIKAEPAIKLNDANCVIITTGFIERLSIKYQERSYRMLMLESGIVGMTMNLVAESLDLSVCWVGSFLDGDLEDFMKIDGVFESINNVMIIGKAN